MSRVRRNVLSSQPLGLSEGKQGILIIVSVAEGEQFRLRSISIQDVTPDGALSISTATLTEQFHLRDGDVFNMTEIRAGLDRLRQIYVNQGYADATAMPDTKIDNASKRIDLTRRITEGPHTKDSLTARDAERVCRSEILIAAPGPDFSAQSMEAKDKVNQVSQAVRSGGAFADLPAANSQAPSAVQGGADGCFKQGQLIGWRSPLLSAAPAASYKSSYRKCRETLGSPRKLTADALVDRRLRFNAS